ncbi:MAG TPA: hypothetical protein DDZ51_04775 [Planctomycetaceae bacterium]|nr:hypothetical protein [Planctomycetaceae bacterium]
MNDDSNASSVRLAANRVAFIPARDPIFRRPSKSHQILYPLTIIGDACDSQSILQSPDEIRSRNLGHRVALSAIELTR